MSNGTIWYLAYHNLPLCLDRKTPVHADRKEEFDDIHWLIERYSHLDAEYIEVKSMNRLTFNRTEWPKKAQ